MPLSESMNMRVTIFGFGTIGRYVAEWLATGPDKLRLDAIVTRTPGESLSFRNAPHLFKAAKLETALATSDIFIDCASPTAFESIARPVIDQGKIFVTVNSGALAEREQLFNRAKETGAVILVPTGALLGLDAVRAAQVGGINSVTLTTRKPPKSFVGVPYVEALQLGVLADIETPILIFRGSAREAAKALPQNINVAASLSFAGIGLDRTMVEVWADPAYERNEHCVTVDGVDTSFTMRIQNNPSVDNPKTSMLTGASVVAALKQLVGSVRIGS
jgi:aspartate dehydrogenase